MAYRREQYRLELLVLKCRCDCGQEHFKIGHRRIGFPLEIVLSVWHEIIVFIILQHSDIFSACRKSVIGRYS